MLVALGKYNYFKYFPRNVFNSGVACKEMKHAQDRNLKESLNSFSLPSERHSMIQVFSLTPRRVSEYIRKESQISSDITLIKGQSHNNSGKLVIALATLLCKKM